MSKSRLVGYVCDNHLHDMANMAITLDGVSLAEVECLKAQKQKALLPQRPCWISLPHPVCKALLVNCCSSFLLLSNLSQLLLEVSHLPLQLAVGALELGLALCCAVLSTLHHSKQAAN